MRRLIIGKTLSRCCCAQPQLEGIDGAEFETPFLEHLMQSRQIPLEKIAQRRQPFGSRKFFCSSHNLLMNDIYRERLSVTVPAKKSTGQAGVLTGWNGTKSDA